MDLFLLYTRKELLVSYEAFYKRQVVLGNLKLILSLVPSTHHFSVKMRFSSLILSAVTLASVFAAPAPNADPAPNERGISVNKKRSNFWFAGVNESGGEFGSGTLPGTLGTNYIWPSTTSIDVSFQYPRAR